MIAWLFLAAGVVVAYFILSPRHRPREPGPRYDRRGLACNCRGREQQRREYNQIVALRAELDAALAVLRELSEYVGGSDAAPHHPARRAVDFLQRVQRDS